MDEFEEHRMPQNYEAKFTPAVGGPPIDVTVSANDASQAKKLIEHQYGPIKGWFKNPTLKR
jgi:hypothetical protein